MKVFRIKDDSLIATSQAIQKKLKASGTLVYKPGTGFADYIDTIKTGSGNAQPSDVLSGKTFTGDDGVEKTGAIETYSGTNIITPSQGGTTLQTQGKYLDKNLNIMGDTDLKPENIRNGINIFGTTGSMQEKLPGYYGVTYATPTADGTIYKTRDKSMFYDFEVAGDSNFKAENIKEGVRIWNVTGTAPSGAILKSFTFNRDINRFENPTGKNIFIYAYDIDTPSPKNFTIEIRDGKTGKQILYIFSQVNYGQMWTQVYYDYDKETKRLKRLNFNATQGLKKETVDACNSLYLFDYHNVNYITFYYYDLD